MLSVSPAPQPECCFLFSGGEEPGLWRFLSPSEGGLCAVPPLLGPYPRPLWFYQVIYPLKEIYPDSGELGPLGTCPPSHCSFSACWGRPPTRLLVSGWVPSTTFSDWLLFQGLYPDLTLFCLPPAEERHPWEEGADHILPWPFPSVLSAVTCRSEPWPPFWCPTSARPLSWCTPSILAVQRH